MHMRRTHSSFSPPKNRVCFGGSGGGVRGKLRRGPARACSRHSGRFLCCCIPPALGARGASPPGRPAGWSTGSRRAFATTASHLSPHARSLTGQGLG
eukprot:scaffold24954_cov174-Isochrysis_galbana.AAC.1